MRSTKAALAALIVLAGAGWRMPAARAWDLDREPVSYSTAREDNPISRLQGRIDAGKAALAFDEKWGYLPAVLRELHISTTSQMLVFSKTSFQRHRIGPRTPRALYFTDDAYVGYVQGGDVVEVTTVDPQLGGVFYTLDQEPAGKPRFQRQGDSCLICHGSSANEGLPGHLVRSLYADGEGFPILSSGTFRIDQTSPLKERWGGWYVTGTSGKQTHLGNLVVRDKRPPEQIDNRAGVNVTDLSRLVKTEPYLTRHSDIVALMVMEHQTGVQNQITRANMLTRMALHDEAEINKALGRPASYQSESTASRIKSACEPLVKYLLFSGEAELTDRVQGTSGFAEAFAARGPRDPKGRSLRDFDLRRRVFKYPCSYQIYSAAFDGLPGAAKDYVLKRVWEVLTGRDRSPEFAHLSAADRQTILEILLATKPNLPAYWRSVSRAGP
jgi:hypothetical protein